MFHKCWKNEWQPICKARGARSHATLKEPPRTVAHMGRGCGSSSPEEMAILEKSNSQLVVPGWRQYCCSVWLRLNLALGGGPAPFPAAQPFRWDSVPLMQADMVIRGIVRGPQLVFLNTFMEKEEPLYSANICDPPERSHSLTIHFPFANVLRRS